MFWPKIKTTVLVLAAVSVIGLGAVLGTYWTGQPGQVAHAVPLPEKPVAEKKPKEADPVVLDNKNNGAIISVPLGSIVEVRLAGTRDNTGWEGGAAKGDALLHLNPEKGKPGQLPSRPGLLPLPFGSKFMPEPGAADKAIGTYVFIYQAVKEGRAEINMDYITPGGPGVTARRRSARIAQFKVTIDVTATKPKGGAEKAPGKLEPEKKEPRFVPIASYPSEQRTTEKRIRELLDAAKIRFITVGSRGLTVNAEADQAKPARAILEKAVKDGSLSVQLLDQLLVPASLRAVRTDDKLRVEEDSAGIEEIVVPVAPGLTRGCHCELSVYRGKERVMHTGGTYTPTQDFNRKADKIPQPGESYEIELVVKWFETDAPVQPNWKPESGAKYKVLVMRTLKLSVGP